MILINILLIFIYINLYHKRIIINYITKNNKIKMKNQKKIKPSLSSKLIYYVSNIIYNIYSIYRTRAKNCKKY